MKRSDLSIIKRAKSLTHAVRGLWLFMKTTPNFWVHFLTAGILIILGIVFKISHTDWMVLILANGLVIVSEAFNTAIEVDINLTSPDFHPYARDTKDIAAGAVLVAGIVAYIIDIFIFTHYIIELLKK
jgi:diacylglycerol kinase